MGQGDIELLIEAEDQASAVLGSFASEAERSFGSVRTAANVAGNATEMFDTSIGTLHERIGSLIEGVDKLSDSINFTPAMMGAAVVAINIATWAWEKLNNKIKEFEESAKEAQKISLDTANAIALMNKELYGLPVAAHVAAYDKSLDVLQKRYEETVKKMEGGSRDEEFQQLMNDEVAIGDKINALKAEREMIMLADLHQKQRDAKKALADYEIELNRKVIEMQGSELEKLHAANEAEFKAMFDKLMFLGQDPDKSPLLRLIKGAMKQTELDLAMSQDAAGAVFGTTATNRKTPELDTRIRQQAAYESRTGAWGPGMIDPAIQASMLHEDKLAERQIKALRDIEDAIKQLKETGTVKFSVASLPEVPG